MMASIILPHKSMIVYLNSFRITSVFSGFTLSKSGTPSRFLSLGANWSGLSYLSVFMRSFTIESLHYSTIYISIIRV